MDKNFEIMRLFLFGIFILMPTVTSNKVCQHFPKEKFELCKEMPYNTTLFPNILDNRNIEEAIKEMEVFSPMIKVACSELLQTFLCSVYAPFCREDTAGIMYPCRSICEKAREGCSELMNRLQFKWPQHLDCKNFPENTGNFKSLCLDETVLSLAYRKKPKENPGGDTPGEYYGKFNCPPHQMKDEKHYNFMGQEGCASKCEPIYFEKTEKEFARNWVLFWSIVCMLSTAFTLLTFVVDMPRFRYPERPIIFLSGCYFTVSTAFLAGPLSGNAVSCHTQLKNRRGEIELLNQGTENASCTVVFMIIYFFLMAASIWWVILTLTWFLAAGLKWGHEAIEASSQYFHAAAWAIPAAKTIAILAMNKVDGDALSGICFVGGNNVGALQGFVIVPLLICLILGTFFLFSGFLALIRIRKVLKDDHSLRTDKLTRLMIRIGIFSVLYSLPAIIVIACLFYEQSYRDTWNESWIKSYMDVPRDCGDKECKDFIGKARPDFTVFIIKYLMLLMVGITSGFWIWSGKTIQSWKMFYYNKILHRPLPRHNDSKDGSSRAAFLSRLM
uniref:Frizzled receptor 1 n=1 Tax=Clytia hemisphaerica TaxID=252671 RepID=A4UAH2_9CNID|nr:frizzled receptor 1 [Clytia hemisphaerica]